MSIRKIPHYWLSQFLGWGTFIAINTFFAITFNQFGPQYLYRLGIFVGIGLFLTHLMRFFIHKVELMKRPLNMQLVGFPLITLVFSIFIGFFETYITLWLKMEYKEEMKLTLSQKLTGNIFPAFVYILIWNGIYFIYHYVAESRQRQVDNLKLEMLVKSLELKTIKAHINPHFIFNSLNSIRALIDEDPERARMAITALSNILRSSMSSDLQETITLEKELSIVKDYLALEKIRFEDRLKISYEIDEDTLDNQVPPMMLQTLVENAIKHGIGKMLAGGEVIIRASETDGFFQLNVLNTGKLDSTSNNEGFGLQSTENRLSLLFGERASFQISENNQGMVEATVMIPGEKK
jgi:sensor histidine kinase YesM